MQNELDLYLKSKNVFIAFENINLLPEEEYAKIRNGGFGASDSAALLGVSPFKSLSELIQEKVTGKYDESIGQKASVRKGKDLEGPILFPKCEKFFNREILKPVHMYGKDNGLRTNFDGVMIDANVYVPVEMKVVTKYGKKYYDFTKAMKDPNIIPTEVKFSKHRIGIEERMNESASHYGIPVYYYTQLQQQMLFLDAPFGYLAVLDDDEWEMRFFMIYRDYIVTEHLEKTSSMQYAKLKVLTGGKSYAEI